MQEMRIRIATNTDTFYADKELPSCKGKFMDGAFEGIQLCRLLRNKKFNFIIDLWVYFYDSSGIKPFENKYFLQDKKKKQFPGRNILANATIRVPLV